MLESLSSFQLSGVGGVVGIGIFGLASSAFSTTIPP